MGNRDERYRGDKPRRPRTDDPRPRNSRGNDSYGSKDSRTRSSRTDKMCIRDSLYGTRNPVPVDLYGVEA